jgi:hypothetical protein
MGDLTYNVMLIMLGVKRYIGTSDVAFELTFT